MISQKQKNIHWTEEETRPPLGQKQTSTPASSWQGWSLWLRILGVVVPLVGGFCRAFPIPGDIPLPNMLLEYALGEFHYDNGKQ